MFDEETHAEAWRNAVARDLNVLIAQDGQPEFRRAVEAITARVADFEGIDRN